MTALQLFRLFVRLHRACVLLESTSGPVQHEIGQALMDARSAVEKKLARPHRARRRPAGHGGGA